MRAAVGIAALAIKSFLWLRTMTPRDAMILQIAAFALLVMMLTIMGGCTPEPKPVGEPICSDPAQRRIDYDFEYCEFKHRDVRSRASSPHEGFIA